MGKLRDSLLNAVKLVANFDKSVKSFSTKALAMSKDSDQWQKSGFHGVDELCLYLMEKLKKKNIDIRTVRDTPLKDYTDANIANYLKGIKFTVDSACNFSTSYDTLVTSLDSDLASVKSVLQDISDQIRKKKKKLFQSKKYKTKIATYEGALDALQDKVATIEAALQELRRVSPTSPQDLRRNLGFTEDSQIRALLAGLDFTRKRLYDDYKSLILKLNQTEKQISEEAEFAGHMKVIKEMVDEAEGLEAE